MKNEAKIFPMNHFKLFFIHFSSVCPFQVHILTHEYHFILFVCSGIARMLGDWNQIQNLFSQSKYLCLSKWKIPVALPLLHPCLSAFPCQRRNILVVYEIRCCWRENNNFFCQNAINFFIPSSRVQYECGYSAQSIYIHILQLFTLVLSGTCMPYSYYKFFYIYFINSDSCHRQ